jgi:protocatechuate 3,4-dioxygenase beta subunit
MESMPANRIAMALGGFALLALHAPRASALEIRVVDTVGGRPIAGASVAWRAGDGKSVTLTSDAAGKVKISVSRKAAGAVRVTASKGGFAPMMMLWEPDKLPAKFDLLLPEAQTLGGRVTDEAGRPVADADISLILPQRLAGPRVTLEEFPVKSNPDGRWRCDIVPKDAAYVFVEISHPEFDSPNGEVALEALRAGTAELKLQAVVTVRGRVLEEGGRAVPNAELMLGRETDIWPGSSTLEARTDADGRFELKRLFLQKRLLGTHAPGFAPSLQLLEIKRDMAPLEVRLKQGMPLRVRVVDQAGQPIPDVETRVDEWQSANKDAGDRSLPGRWNYPGWEWQTGADGRVTMSNAPSGTMFWSFTKGGYMGRGRHGLRAAPEEDVVTLGPPFRASGKVTDAVTGQPVMEFVLTPRFAQTFSLNGGATRTNFGPWTEYNRKPSFNGEFSFYGDSPLLHGRSEMHDWQFRVEADGYEPAVSRLVRDEERGARLDFRLTPRPLPELSVPAPRGARRVTAAVAVQPSKVRPGNTLTLFVKARVAAGHHIYALEESGCSNLPTTLEASLPGVLRPDGPWRGPEPKVQDDGSRTLAGEVLFKRRFLIEGNRSGARTHKLAATLRFQVCNEALCWPAETISLETEFEVVTSPE